MKSFQFWLGIVVAGVVLLFTLQNIATVEVNFLIWSLSVPCAVLIFVLFGAGILVGLLLARVPLRQHDEFH